MPQRYLLPCSCGRRVEVDAGQAGLSVACACGAMLKVPALRGLAHLEPVVSVSPAGNTWGGRGRLLTLGLLLTLVGGVVFLALRFTFPLPPAAAAEVEQIESLSLLQSWHLWRQVSQGIDAPHDAHAWQVYEYSVSRYRMWMWLSGILAAAGALLILVGWLCFAQHNTAAANNGSAAN